MEIVRHGPQRLYNSKLSKKSEANIGLEGLEIFIFKNSV